MSTAATIKNIAVTVAGDLVHLSIPQLGGCVEVAVQDVDELYQGVKDLIGKEKAALEAERAAQAASAPAVPQDAAPLDVASLQAQFAQLQKQLAALVGGGGPAIPAGQSDQSPAPSA
jgi:hypothetical protein